MGSTAGQSSYPLLSTLIEERAERVPDRVAMIHKGRSTTYAGLDRRASQVANAVLAEDIGRNGRVAYLGKNSDIYFELLFGTIRAGAVLLAVNWRLAAPEVAYILNDAEARLLFVESEFLPLIEQIRPQLPHLHKVIIMDRVVTSYADFASWRDRHGDARPDLVIAPRDPVLQMYTSGTTGHPKGVMMSNESVCALRATESADGDWTQWDDGEVNLVSMPCFHIAGTGWAIVGFYFAATNIILPQPDAEAIVDAIARYRVNRLLIVPALIQMIVDRADIADHDLSSVKTLYYGASPISESLLARTIAVFGCEFVQLYGMTETAGTIAHLPPDQHKTGDAARMTSCGRAVAGTEIRIVNDKGEALPRGQVGEIAIKSPTAMLGYWRRPEATAEVLRDGWYYSGDAGYLDEEGYLYICDRIKDMIVSGGENIYPAEVESVLAAHPGVAEVAVIGVPDTKWGEAVKAVVALRPGASVAEEDIIAFARGRIAGYKVPKSVDFVSTLPRNPSGKILKRELRKPYWEGRSRQVG